MNTDGNKGLMLGAEEPEGSELEAVQTGESIERRRWCEKLTARVLELVEGDAKEGAPERMAEDEAMRQAMLLWDLGERYGQANVRFGDHPSELMLAYQLEQQGVSPVAALVTAQTMLSVDMGRLVLTAPEAQRLVGVSRTTLMRQVDHGKVRPAIHVQKGERDRLLCYWASDVLWILGWRRTNAHRPGPYSWYPDPVPSRAGAA